MDGATHINSNMWKPNSDGTITLHFNCGDDAINNLSSGGEPFNYAIRNYGVSQKVLDGEFRPLEPGYGITVGNSLRRILLSSLEGFAIASVKIQGVDHEFSTIKGVVEDVTEIILNLKQVRFKRQIEGTDSETVVVTVGGQSKLTAGDIGKHTSAFQVLNPELVICNMENSVKIEMEICFKDFL